ncbi:SEC-C metal-binding domain-containing protein [Pseudomonas sp. NDM]
MPAPCPCGSGRAAGD